MTDTLSKAQLVSLGEDCPAVLYRGAIQVDDLLRELSWGDEWMTKLSPDQRRTLANSPPLKRDQGDRFLTLFQTAWDDRCGFFFKKEGKTAYPLNHLSPYNYDSLVDAYQDVYQQVTDFLGCSPNLFDEVMVNRYTIQGGVGWHTDADTVSRDRVAMLSLGDTRSMGLCRGDHPSRRRGATERHFPVRHGDLVFMPSGMQQEWLHCIDKPDLQGKTEKDIRYSLIFRETRIN